LSTKVSGRAEVALVEIGRSMSDIKDYEDFIQLVGFETAKKISFLADYLSDKGFLTRAAALREAISYYLCREEGEVNPLVQEALDRGYF